MERELLRSTNESEFAKHEPCPKCGSKDNLGRYTDGHAHCFGCGYYEHADGTQREIKRGTMNSEFVSGTAEGLGKRKIRDRTCEKFGYMIGEYKGIPCQIAPLYKDNKLVAQKLRLPNKQFKIVGEGKNLPFFGQNLWEKGKKLVVTEGEIDCLSVSQLQDNKWPTVSVPNGAQGAEKCFTNNIEWLQNFEEVIIMFDMDDVGQEAAKACASVLKPNQAKIASLPLKDANELLVAGRGQEVIQAIWNAKKYRPDGVIEGVDTWERLKAWECPQGFPYPWEVLQEMTRGCREREITVFTSGSGLGKSTICRELATSMLHDNIKVGYIALEESIERTTLGFMSIDVNRPLHLEKPDFDSEELKEAWEHTCGKGNLFLYDHFGSLDSDSLLNKIRYMVVGLGCSYIYLDHISIVVSGMDSDNERKDIDVLMTKLRSLVEETGVGVILVSHLKRPEGRSHEEGGRVTLAQLRGSGAIAQLSDMVIGLERDQQGENPNELKLRVLKSRYVGEVGLADSLNYDRDTGRLGNGCPF